PLALAINNRDNIASRGPAAMDIEADPRPPFTDKISGKYRVARGRDVQPNLLGRDFSPGIATLRRLSEVAAFPRPSVPVSSPIRVEFSPALPSLAVFPAWEESSSLLVSWTCPRAS